MLISSYTFSEQNIIRKKYLLWKYPWLLRFNLHDFFIFSTKMFNFFLDYEIHIYDYVHEIWKTERSEQRWSGLQGTSCLLITNQISVFHLSLFLSSIIPNNMHLSQKNMHTHTHTGEHLCYTAIIPTISILWFPFNTQEIVQHKHLEINTYHVYRDIRQFSLWNLCTCACLWYKSSYCLRLHRSPCTTNIQS